MNPISDRINTGTIGEILVQLRLLQYDVQAAPPIKDSGNDLIAVRRNVFCAIQVKTTTHPKGIFNKPRSNLHYHALAVVHLVGEGKTILLDESPIYLIPREIVLLDRTHNGYIKTTCSDLDRYLLSQELIDRIFHDWHAHTSMILL